MKNRILKLLACFMFIIPCLCMFAACGEKEDKKTATGLSVELYGTSYTLTNGTITTAYGEKIDLGTDDFTVTVNYDDESSETISVKTEKKDGYTFASTIPTNGEKTPVGEYTITFGYGDLEDVVITVKVVKATIDMTNVDWNYSDEYSYDGTEKEVKLTGLPSCVEVAYEGVSKATIPGEYSVTAKFTVDTACYNAISDMALDWEIEKGTINVSGVRLENYVYDGATRHATVSPETLPENVEVEAYYGETSGVVAGTYIVTYTLSYIGEDAEYYNEIRLQSGAWEIAKAPYTKSLNTIKLKEDYDFTYDATAKSVEVDTSNIDYYLKVSGYSGNIATLPGDHVVSVNLEYIGADANYCSPEPVTLQWTIKKATLTVFVFNSEINYGEAPINRGYAITGYVDEAHQSLPNGRPIVTFGGYAKGSNAGKYDITVEGLSSDLYDFNIIPGKLTVNKVDLTIDVIDTVISYNEEPTNNGVSVSGLVLDDTIEDLGQFTYNYGGYEKGSPCGTYDITITNLDDTNYNITINKGTLTVQIADLDIDLTGISLKNPEVEYTGELVVPEVDESTLPEGVSVTSINVQFSEPINVGEYKVVIGLKYKDTTNYNPLGTIARLLTITKATISFEEIELDNTEFVYNKNTYTVTIDETLPKGVEIHSVQNNSAIDAGNYKAIYTLVCSDTRNYVDFGTKTLEFDWEILPKELTITVSDFEITWGEEPRGGAHETKGFASGDSAATILSGEAEYVHEYQEGGDVGEYSITISGITLVSNNYTLKVVDGKLTVKPVVVDMSAVEWSLPTSLPYNGETQKPTITNLPSGVSVEYKYTQNDVEADCVAVGDYVVQVALTPAKNHTIAQTTITYEFSIEQAIIDVSTLEWEDEDGHQYKYSEEDRLPIVKTELKNVAYDYTYYLYDDDLGDYKVCTVNPNAVGRYKAVVRISTTDSNYTIINSDQVSEFTFEIVKRQIAVENVKLQGNSSVIVESLEYSQMRELVLEYTGVQRTLNITADNINKFDVTYSTDRVVYSETNSFSATDAGEYSFWIKFALKEADVKNYTFSNSSATFVELHINLEIQVSPFTSITLNGEAYSYDELIRAEGFKPGSVLEFTVNEGYKVTDTSGTELTSVTLSNWSKTIYVNAVNEDGVVTSTLLRKTLDIIVVDEIKIGRNDAVIGMSRSYSYYLDKDEDSITISFDEKYLTEYQSVGFHGDKYTDYRTVQVTSLPITLTNLSEYLGSSKCVPVSLYFRYDEEHSTEITISIYAYNPIEAYYVETVDEVGNLTAEETGLNVSLYNKILVGFYAIGKDGKKYDNVKLYADYDRTEEVSLTNLNKIMGRVGLYYTIYDEVGNSLDEGSIYTYGDMGSILFDDERIATHEVSYYDTEYTPYSYSNSLVTIKTTVAGQTSAFALANDLTETSFKYEFSYGGKTYTYDGQIRIIRSASIYNVSNESSLLIINTRTSKTYTIENYTSGRITHLYTDGNASNPDYTPNTIDALRADLQYFTLSGLRDGYVLESVELVLTDETALLKFTIKNGETTYALYSRIFTAGYSSTIKTTVEVYNEATGEYTHQTGDTIEILSFRCEQLLINAGRYEKVVVYNMDNSIIFDEVDLKRYEYITLPSAGTYRLVITSSNGKTTKTITINASGEDLPVFKLEIGETTKVIENFDDEPDGFIFTDYTDGLELWTSVGSSHLASVEDGMIQIDKISSYLAEYAKVYDSRGFEIDLSTSFKTPVLEDNIGRKYFELQIEVMYYGDEENFVIRFYLADEAVCNIFNINVGGKEYYYGANENLEYVMDAEFAYNGEIEEAELFSEVYLGSSEQAKIVDGYYTINHVHSDFPFNAYDGNLTGGNAVTQLIAFKNVPFKVENYNGKQCVVVIIEVMVDDGYYYTTELRFYLEDEPALELELSDNLYVLNDDGTTEGLTEEVGTSDEYKEYSVYLGNGADDLISADDTVMLESIFAGEKVVSVTDMVIDYIYEVNGHTKFLTNIELGVGNDSESRRYARMMVEMVDGESTKKVMVNFYFYELNNEPAQ